MKGQRRPSRSPVPRAWSGRWSTPGSRSSSASPAARSSRRTTRLIDSEKIRHILVRHEQGAGHAAQGYAVGDRQGRRLHGDVGPGRDEPGHRRSPTPTWTRSRSSPSPARSPVAAIGTDAFQEADIRGITMPITKHNFLVTDAAEIPRAIAEAFHIASTGRPGPVLVDVAKDALQAMTTFAWPTELDLPGYRPATKPARQAGPGGGPADRSRPSVPCCTSAAASSSATPPRSCKVLAELTGIPVVTTLMARGAFPDSHPQHLGMPGMHGTVAAVARAAEERPADHARRPLRRPGHRQAGLVRARREGHPRRHRPGRDLQEPHGRRADRR